MRPETRRELAGFAYICAVVCLVTASLWLGQDVPAVRIEGIVTEDRDVVRLRDEERILIGFTPTGWVEKRNYYAEVDPAGGTFTVNMTPGAYHVSLSVIPQVWDAAGMARTEALRRRFSRINGKEFEVLDTSGQRIRIDIARGTMSR